MKIGTYTLSATVTSANATSFNFGDVPAGTNGEVSRFWLKLPAVSAATCCAGFSLKDGSSNYIWRSATDGSTVAEASSGVSACSFFIVDPSNETFAVDWSARPSGGDGAVKGANVTAELRIWVKEG